MAEDKTPAKVEILFLASAEVESKLCIVTAEALPDGGLKYTATDMAAKTRRYALLDVGEVARLLGTDGLVFAKGCSRQDHEKLVSGVEQWSVTLEAASGEHVMKMAATYGEGEAAMSGEAAPPPTPCLEGNESMPEPAAAAAAAAAPAVTPPPPPPPPPRRKGVCAMCGKSALKFCSQCGNVFYCRCMFP